MTGLLSKSRPASPVKHGIEVSRVSFSYGQKKILENIDLSIPNGEIWALVGRSGIGKTTLINILLGIFRPDSGQINTEQGPITKPGSVRGVVFQDDTLLWWLTVLENVLFPLHKDANLEYTQRARLLLEMVGLSEACDLRPKQLSTGMKKRVELARALCIDQSYLIADEPFAALDLPTRIDLWLSWRSLRKANPRTGIICTHDPVEAAAVADSIVVLRVDNDGNPETKVIQVPARIRSADDATSFIFADSFIQEIIELVA